MKKTIQFCCAMLVILGAVVFLNRAVIIQRGNPIPYLIAASQISQENPYVAVDEAGGIYIAKRGECPELFAYFENLTGAEFVEQAGSGYIFHSETNAYVISSEIYWGRYTVWTLPTN